MSTFTTHQTQFLRRLVSERPAERRPGGAASYFCQNFSLGTSVGQVVIYSESHFRMAEKLLVAHDLPVVAPGADSSRADIAAFGGMSEKDLSTKPHADSVAVRFVGRCSLDGVGVATPAAAYLVMAVADVSKVQCDRLLVVENLETFRQLERYRWIDYREQSVLVVFRGDPRLSVGDALLAIQGSPVPIWAFFDFDPAGLMMANALPSERLERLVLPSMEWLEIAADAARGRQLFADQLPGCGAVLDAAVHPAVSNAWSLMRRLRSGVTQERMLSAPSTGTV